MDKLISLYHEQDKIEFYANLLTLLCSITIVIRFALAYNQLPSRLPLFYSLNWGDSQLVNKPQFIILPSLILLIALINLIITWQLHTSQLILKRVISIATTSIALLILITALKIIGIFI